MGAIDSLSNRFSEGFNELFGPFANWLNGYVWGPSWLPFIAVLLLGTGVFVTLRLLLVQVRGFKHAIDITRGKYDDPADAGDVVHFQALTTALSATVGIGNIAGVAIAIRMGGPGALFWMWVSAFFGMALKYAECTLAVKYRTVHADGSVSGGPMYYIERGLGEKWGGFAKALAVFFAGCAIIASFGGGCMNQSNTLANTLESEFSIPPIMSAIVFSALVALVIVGGIRRIGKVTSILAPGMAALYVAGALYILIVNFSAVPSSFVLIVRQAFAPESLVGGGIGAFMITFVWGLKRGLFSNEAGQGSAPIAHAAAKTDEPVREGLVASLEPFIDTLVICTMTGLVIVTTGAFKEKTPEALPLSSVAAVLAEAPADAELQDLYADRADSNGGTIRVVDGRAVDGAFLAFHSAIEGAVVEADGRPWSGELSVGADGDVSVSEDVALTVRGDALVTGAELTAQGFTHGLPGKWGGGLVAFAVMLFAVSTGISWSYYGDRATEYLFGRAAIPVYRWIFIAFFFMGCLLSLDAVWNYGDAALGLMTFPNLIALLLLSPVVARMTREYFSRDHRRGR